MWANLGWSARKAGLQGWMVGHGRLIWRQRRQHWLLSKKNDELKRAAIACGTPCSGTKHLLAEGLEDALSRNGDHIGRDLSIVSVDMGIRNLAYCHLNTKLHVSKRPEEEVWADVKIDTWRRIDVSGEAGSFQLLATSPSAGPVRGKGTKTKKAANPEQVDENDSTRLTKESFNPSIYAERSYKFIQHILQEHRPTHVLIERQRFRSGGGPAVQEWTLRVGMFEFMLYATLHTLAAQGIHNAEVISVQPPMVNRYWLSQTDMFKDALAAKPTSAAMKKYKIEQVARMLEVDEDTLDRELIFSGQASKLKNEFLEKVTQSRKGSKITSLPKLDDVSDCLLQGLAWIAWQENRGRLQALRSTTRSRSVDLSAVEGDPLLPWTTGQ